MSVKCFYNLRLCQYIFQQKEIHETTLKTIKIKLFVSKVCRFLAQGSILWIVVLFEHTEYMLTQFIFISIKLPDTKYISTKIRLSGIKV